MVLKTTIDVFDLTNDIILQQPKQTILLNKQFYVLLIAFDFIAAYASVFDYCMILYITKNRFFLFYVYFYIIFVEFLVLTQSNGFLLQILMLFFSV